MCSPDSQSGSRVSTEWKVALHPPTRDPVRSRLRKSHLLQQISPVLLPEIKIQVNRLRGLLNTESPNLPHNLLPFVRPVVTINKNLRVVRMRLHVDRRTVGIRTHDPERITLLERHNQIARFLDIRPVRNLDAPEKPQTHPQKHDNRRTHDPTAPEVASLLMALSDSIP